jgi:hypothetical protein
MRLLSVVMLPMDKLETWSVIRVAFRGLRTALTTQLRQKNKMNKFIS